MLHAFKRTIVLFHLRADDLASDFGLQGIPVQSLHGNREQCDREQALDDFKTGRLIPKLTLNKPVLLKFIMCRIFFLCALSLHYRNEKTRALKGIWLLC